MCQPQALSPPPKLVLAPSCLEEKAQLAFRASGQSVLAALRGGATRGAAEEAGKASSIYCADGLCRRAGGRGEAKAEPRDRVHSHATGDRAAMRTLTSSRCLLSGETGVLLYSPDWPGTSYVDQAGLKIPAICLFSAEIKDTRHRVWLFLFLREGFDG